MTFDQYCEQHGIAADERPAAFAAYLHQVDGWDGDYAVTTGEQSGTEDTTSTGAP